MSIQKSRNQIKRSLFTNNPNELNRILSPDIRPRKLNPQDNNNKALLDCFALKKKEAKDLISRSFTINYMPLSPKEKINHLESMDTESASRFRKYSLIFDEIKEQIKGINNKIESNNNKRGRNSIVLIPMSNGKGLNSLNNNNNNELGIAKKIRRSITNDNTNESNNNGNNYKLYKEDEDKSNDDELFDSSNYDNEDDSDVDEEYSINHHLLRNSNYTGGRKQTIKSNNKTLSQCATKVERIGTHLAKGEANDKIFKIAKKELKKVITTIHHNRIKSIQEADNEDLVNTEPTNVNTNTNTNTNINKTVACNIQ